MERLILGVHLAGFLFLFLFGCLDVFFAYYIPRPFYVSFNTFGSLAFGISMSLILLERILALLRDREAMDAQLRTAFRDVAESRGLRLVGESAAMVHHEVKNYVCLIKGNLRLLASEGGLAEDARTGLDRIPRSTEGLENLAQGILNLPSAFAINPCGHVPLAALLDELILKEFGTGPLRCSLDTGNLDMRIRGDAFKLEQAFHNLLKNSREAGESHALIRFARRTHAVVVSIEDNGPGCDPARMAALGQAFFTTRNGAGGNGLGICVAKAIIENHGGTLAFHCKNGLPNLGTGLLADAVFPMEPEEGADSPDPRGIPVFARDPGLRDRLASVVKNIFLSPLDPSGQAHGSVPEGDLALVEEGLMKASFANCS